VKLATIRTLDGRTRAVRVEDERLVDLGAADLGVLLATPGWEERATAATEPVPEVRGAAFAPVVPRPGKIVCVGLNYRNHILEMGRDLPEYPTLFSKYADTPLSVRTTTSSSRRRPARSTGKANWRCSSALTSAGHAAPMRAGDRGLRGAR
jgi:2-keto-4-pentenoate hydratase/2-oxohepta-3-ene-1,7-dioic acid hydratase in catechol pathway